MGRQKIFGAFKQNKMAKGNKKKIVITITYLLTGLVISSLNTIIEALAYKYDLYEIKGPWKILATPFPMFILWIFLSFIYIDVYYRIKNKFPSLLYVILGIVLGWCFDFIGWKIGLLEIKEKGSPFINALVWVILVPLTLVIPKMILKEK